jgi:hypothetical protein
MDWETWVQSPTEVEDFSSALCTQPGSEAHPASCTVGTGGSFPGGKVWPGHDADHSSPSSAKVKKERGYTSSPSKCPSWRIVGELYFYFTFSADSTITFVHNLDYCNLT